MYYHCYHFHLVFTSLEREMKKSKDQNQNNVPNEIGRGEWKILINMFGMEDHFERKQTPVQHFISIFYCSISSKSMHFWVHQDILLQDSTIDILTAYQEIKSSKTILNDLRMDPGKEFSPMCSNDHNS